MYTKRISLCCAIVVIAAGLVACGSTNQALKTQQTATGPAAGSQKSPAGTTAANAGAQKTDGNVSSSTTAQTRGAGSSVAAVLKDIYFDFDQHLITSDSASVLKQNAQWFDSNPSGKIRIEGNCDERGTVEYNLALGQRRADAAKTYLVNLGVDAKKIETVSYGKEKPVDAAGTPEAWAKNRRDHFATSK